jgi:penicillin-binding protein 1C
MFLRACIAALCLTCVVTSATATTPSFDEVKAAWVSTERTFHDRHGVVLQSLRADQASRRLQWLPLSAMSPALIDALIAAEDRRFFEHAGVDWTAVSQALWDNVTRSRPRGASTISMQVAALLDPDRLAIEGARRSAWQKLNQAAAAKAIERDWSKSQILEAYFNLTSFRGELVGIDAASEALFGRSARALDNTDSAILAALVRAPNADARLVARRACALLARMAVTAQGTDRCESITVRARTALARPYRLAPRVNEAPHFARWHHESTTTASAQVTTRLIAAVQRAALASAQQHLAELSSRNVRDAAIVVLDNRSGDIIAYIGGTGSLASSPQLDLARAKRQAGSTLKPFIYAAGIEAQVLTAASIIDDAPTAFVTAGGVYNPRNYDRDFKGPVSVRTALASSLNIPAVKALELVGVERGHRLLNAVGIGAVSEAPDFYGFALALGGVDVSLLELTNAYRTLANAGVYTPISAQGGLPQRHVALSPATAYIIADILGDRSARAITFGTDSVLVTRVWSAVKTGTSKDMRDNWAIGFSQHFTVGVWVGNADGSPMKEVSGVAGAAPIWADVMHVLHADIRSRAPRVPDTVTAQDIDYVPAVEAPRREWFIKGTQSARLVLADSARAPRITYPTAGLLIARDPDIPRGRERVPVDMVGRIRDERLRLNGRALNESSFEPLAGRQLLELVAGDGRVLQSIAFEVR